MSKESIIKKRLEKMAKDNPAPEQPAQPQKRRVVMPVIQRPRRRFSRRFILMFSIWVVALIVALYFISR